MNEKMRGINIQEKASMCGKSKMWLVMVVFALISTAMLSSVKIHAASAEETSASASEVGSIMEDVSQNANMLDEIAVKLNENVKRFKI